MLLTCCTLLTSGDEVSFSSADPPTRGDLEITARGLVVECLYIRSFGVLDPGEASEVRVIHFTLKKP